MNSKKYDGVDHPVRHVTDLKDIIVSSTTMFADKAAYLQKDRPNGTFRPIYYKQVKKDMDALGTKFVEMGLKDKKIAVIGETSYFWFLSYFATVCGTGVIVPLDRKLPPDEIKTLINRSHADAIVFSQQVEESVEPLFDEPYNLRYFIDMNAEKDTDPTLSLRKLIAEGEKLLEAGNRDFVDAKIDPDQMSTLIFTSGTTGTAKGVMLSHRNIAANVENMSRREHLEEDWVVLSILPAHHTFENTCVDWTTFYQGKTLAICENVRHILKDMKEVHAECMVGVPLVFEKIYKGMMKQADQRGEGEKLRRAIKLSRQLKLYNNDALMSRMFKTIHEALGGHMHQFISGGAAIDPEIIEGFEAMGIPMMQGYGMTECAPIICVNQDNYSIAESVGRPMHDTEVKIDNPDRDGVGEIIVKSPSVMLGYYEDEEATKEVLRDGWLHTGDLGYMDNRGFVYLTGREKTVIVTKGGKNIFPEELEAVLKENPLVKECLVYGVNDKKVGNVIVTADIQPNYQLLDEQYAGMTGSDVYHFYKKLVDGVNDKLPQYKAIKRVNIRNNDFAMTTTGKVKRYGNFIESKENYGSSAYREIKEKERREAEAVIQAIKDSPDPYVRYRDQHAVYDMKQLLISSAELYGDAPAFHQKFKKGEPYTTISFKQALVDVNGLGTAFINHGLKGKRIALIGDSRYFWTSSCLAVIGGVGVAVPIDKELGAAEIKNLLIQSEASAVMFDKRFESMFRQFMKDGDTGLEMLVNFDAEEENDGVYAWKQLLEEGKDSVARGDRQYIDAEVIASDMVLLIFTSGTMGFSKGVMLSHTNICHDLMIAPAILDITPADTLLSVLPIHHTYELTCAFLIPIYDGASVAYNEGLKYIQKNIEEVQPTIIMAVPLIIEAMYRRIMNNIKKAGKEETLKRLMKVNDRTKKLGINVLGPFSKEIQKGLGGRFRLFISGGAALRPEISEFFNDMKIMTVQGYGLTECSPMVSLNPDSFKLLRPASAGHVFPCEECKIIDQDENGIGEICFKGRNVMMGYYRNPEATKEVLIDGWYHTGDLGYLDKDNFVYITGRKKNVIITDNGQNVFPEELEFEIDKIPYVAESMVWGDEEGVNSTSIVATIYPDAGAVKEKLGENYTDEDVQKLLWEEVDKINSTLPFFKKIKKIVVRKEDFQKTTAHKIKRFVESNRESGAER